MVNPFAIFGAREKEDDRLGFLVKIDKSDVKGSKISFDINIGNVTAKELAMLEYYLRIIKNALDKKKEKLKKDEDVDLDYSQDMLMDTPEKTKIEKKDKPEVENDILPYPKG